MITVTRRASGAADRSKTIHDRASTAPPQPAGFFVSGRFLVCRSHTTCTSRPSVAGGVATVVCLVKQNGLQKTRRARARGDSGRRERRSADGRLHERRPRWQRRKKPGLRRFTAARGKNCGPRAKHRGTSWPSSKSLSIAMTTRCSCKVKRMGDGNVCHTGERTCFRDWSRHTKQ